MDKKIDGTIGELIQVLQDYQRRYGSDFPVQLMAISDSKWGTIPVSQIMLVDEDAVDDWCLDSPCIIID